MGVSHTPEQLIGKLAKFRTKLVGAQREGVRVGALLATNTIRVELRATVPSGRLSGVGRRGARLSVGFDAPSSTTNPQAVVRARGPWQLIESNTRPHTIKRRRRRALAGRGFGPVASVDHPGTKGKHPWTKGVRRAEPQLLAAMDAAVFKAMQEAFR